MIEQSTRVMVLNGKSTRVWGAVAEWLARRLLNLLFTGSNTGGATWSARSNFLSKLDTRLCVVVDDWLALGSDASGLISIMTISHIIMHHEVFWSHRYCNSLWYLAWSLARGARSRTTAINAIVTAYRRFLALHWHCWALIDWSGPFPVLTVDDGSYNTLHLPPFRHSVSSECRHTPACDRDRVLGTGWPSARIPESDTAQRRSTPNARISPRFCCELKESACIYARKTTSV